MAETKTVEQDQEQNSKDRFGRVLDIAGIFAGLVIGVILFDVLSGGKVTRLLSRGKPCEDCKDKAEQEEATRDG